MTGLHHREFVSSDLASPVSAFTFVLHICYKTVCLENISVSLGVSDAVGPGTSDWDSVVLTIPIRKSHMRQHSENPGQLGLGRTSAECEDHIGTLQCLLRDTTTSGAEEATAIGLSLFKPAPGLDSETGFGFGGLCLGSL